MSSTHLGIDVEVVGRHTDAWVLAVSGELSLPAVGLVTSWLSKGLADPGRVLVDVSALHVTSPALVALFSTVLAGAGGWPGARLVLFGAGPELTRTMTALGVPSTVPLAADEAGARRLLDRRPPLVVRRLELEHTTSSARRARSFVDAACTDWQLDMIRHDAIAVASELVANAVLHAGTGCRLVLRYRTRGLRVGVYDRNPARLPELRPLVEGEGMHGLSIVAALSLQWGVGRDRDEKCVWAVLPAAATTPYSYATRAAAHDAVRAVLMHGTHSPDAAVEVGRLVARLADEHGPDFVRKLGGELAGLVAELAEANSAVDDPAGQVASGHTAPGRDPGPS